MTALLVIAILVLLIIVHEFGHFIVAKIFKVRVEEFGVGYPPRAFLLGKIGRTEYTLNWIPFGGFVRLYGDDGNFDKGHGSLADASRSVQAAILIAGVAANAILAWILFAGALTIGVPSLVDAPIPGETTHLYVSDVVVGSPAAAGGIAAGDEIVAIEDAKGEKLSNFSPAGTRDFVRTRGGQGLKVSYIHDGEQTSSIVHPANAVVPGAAGRPALGVGLALVANRSLSWADAILAAFPMTMKAFVMTMQNLWTILAGAVTGTADLSQVVGPIGLVSVVGAAYQNGIGNVLKLAAFISVNLAIINLFPIPALDGGRLVVLAVEAIRRKNVSRITIQVLNTIGIGCVILLMVVVTYHDIGRLLS